MPRIAGEEGCLGSFQMEKHLSEVGPKRAASRGERIHAVLEGKLPVESLGHSERICYERTAFEEARLVDWHGLEGADIVREMRFWGKDDLGEELFSAKPDVIYVLGNKAMVLNFKTGFYAPDPIWKNEQMNCEGAAFAASLDFQLDRLTIGLIHPNYQLPMPDSNAADSKIAQCHTITNMEEVKNIHERMQRTSLAALDEDAPRTPSAKACQFCLGRKLRCCPEFLEQEDRLEFPTFQYKGILR